MLHVEEKWKIPMSDGFDCWTEEGLQMDKPFDPELLDHVLELSGESTKKAAVTLALKEFVARREQRKITDLFGKLDWDVSFDYKAERSRS